MFAAQPRASLPPVARARRRHRAVAGILGALADIGGPGHGGDLRGTPVAAQDLLLPPFLSAQIHTDIFLRAGLIESHRKNLAISPPPPPACHGARDLDWGDRRQHGRVANERGKGKAWRCWQRTGDKTRPGG